MIFAVKPPTRNLPANRMLLPHTDEPAAELGAFIVQRMTHLTEDLAKEVLRSHSISPETLGMLQNDEVSLFLETRGQDIQQEFQQFSDTVCEWDFEDTPSLPNLILGNLEEQDD